MLTFFVCLLAGLGAGLGTGFAGMSAAAVISPMLIAFLDMEPYQAIGIALASDVLASAVSAYTYGKNKNLDIKNARYDVHRHDLYFYCKLSGQFYPKHDNGRIFHLYDTATRDQIYRKTCYDNQGSHGCH